DRVVALKVIRMGAHASPDERARFLGEARAVAAISHSGIVQVYDCGTHAGLPFINLELCTGGSLAQKLGGTPLPAEKSAGIVEQVARAMQAAHDKGILHRDLKPSNVLLDHEGKPKVADFGLARLLDRDSGATPTGAAVGTPSYMPPEQARGE